MSIAARQARLRRWPVGLQRGGQVGTRGVEVVVELAQHGADHAHRRRGVGRRPPRCQRRLRVAHVARVAFGLHLAVVAPGRSTAMSTSCGFAASRRRRSAISRRRGFGGAAGQAFEHLAVGRRGVGRGSGRPGRKGRGQQKENSKHAGVYAAPATSDVLSTDRPPLRWWQGREQLPARQPSKQLREYSHDKLVSCSSPPCSPWVPLAPKPPPRRWRADEGQRSRCQEGRQEGRNEEEEKKEEKKK